MNKEVFEPAGLRVLSPREVALQFVSHHGPFLYDKGSCFLALADSWRSSE